MDPGIRRPRGKARGPLRVPINQPGLPYPTEHSQILPSGLHGIYERREPRPVYFAQPVQTPITGPRPYISQPISSIQPLQPTVTSMYMQHPTRQLPQRAPRQMPYGPKPVVFREKSTVPKQDTVAGVGVIIF